MLLTEGSQVERRLSAAAVPTNVLGESLFEKTKLEERNRNGRKQEHAEEALLIKHKSSYKSYLNEISYRFQLEKLYKIVGTNYHNELSLVCPVLVQIMDPQLIDMSIKLSQEDEPGRQFDEDKDHYLVQLWSKTGYVFYERHTQRKIKHMWTSEISDRIARRLSPDVFGQQSQNPMDAVDKDEEAKNQYKDSTLFVYIDRNDDDQDVVTCVLILKEHNPEVHQFFLSDIGYNNQEELDSLHMGISSGHLILCSKTQVWYADLIKILSLKIEASESLENEEIILAEIPNWSFEQLTIAKVRNPKYKNAWDEKEVLKYNIMGINDLGQGNAAIIAEEVEDNFLVFFRMDFNVKEKVLELNLIEKSPNDRQGEQGGKKEQKDYRLKPEFVKSVVVKAKDHFNDEQNFMHYCIAIREDNSIDFYCNFIYVSTIKPETELKGKKVGKVIAAEMDFTKIYFTTERPKGAGKNAPTQFSVDLSWQRLVGLATFKVNKQYLAMESALDRKISNHFRLYSRFVTYKTYFLIAHRNIVTVFDLSEFTKDDSNEMEHFFFKDMICGLTVIDVESPMDTNCFVPRQFQDAASGLPDLHNKAEVLSGRSSQQQDFQHSMILSQKQKARMNQRYEDIKIKSQRIKRDSQDKMTSIEHEDPTNSFDAGYNYLIVQVGLQKLNFLIFEKNDNPKCMADKIVALNTQIKVPPIKRIVQDENRKRQREAVFLMRQIKNLKDQLDFEADDEVQLMRTMNDTGLPSYTIQNVEYVKTITDPQKEWMFIAYNGRSFDKIKGNLSSEAKMNLYRLANYTYTGEEDEQKVYTEKQRTVVMGLQTKFNSVNRLFSLDCNIDNKNEVNDHFQDNQNDKRLKELHSIDLVENKEKWWGADASKNKLIGIFKFSLDDTNTPEKEFYILEVLCDRISIYNSAGQKEYTHTGLDIKDVVMNDYRYLYVLQGQLYAQMDPHIDEHIEGGRDDQSAGVYIFDMYQLVKRKSISVKLTGAITSRYSTLVYSSFNDRIAYLQDFKTLMFMPLIHRNTLKFIGMDHRSKYLAWHEHDGLFSAFNAEQKLIQTWNMLSGKLVKCDQHEEKPELYNELQDFEIYQKVSDGEKYDNNYMEDQFNFTHHAYQLVIKKDGASKSKRERLIDFAFGQFTGEKPKKEEIPALLDSIKEKFRELDTKDKLLISQIVQDKNADKRIWSWGNAKLPSKEEIDIMAEELEVEQEELEETHRVEHLRNSLGRSMLNRLTSQLEENIKEEAFRRVEILDQVTNAHKEYMQEEQLDTKFKPDNLGFKIKVFESNQLVRAKEFKVLEMQSQGRIFTNDLDEYGRRKEDHPIVELREKFRFSHDVYRQEGNKFKMSKPSYPRQHLILSDDTTKLLEVVFEKGQVSIYQRRKRVFEHGVEENKYMNNDQLRRLQNSLRKQGKTEQEVLQVNFVKIKNVPTFSQMLCQVSHKNTTFSPDFTRMLQVDMSKGHFSIYNVEEEKTEVIIDNDFLPCNFSAQRISVASVQKIAKRMQLLNGCKLRVLNEDDLDAIISFEHCKKKGKKIPKIESICKMDNVPDLFTGSHLYLEPTRFKPDQTMFRMMRSARYHKVWLKHGSKLLANRDKYYKPSKFDIFKHIYTVDYSEAPNKSNSSFFLQQSFSLLDWMLTEKIMKKGTQIEIDDLPERNIMRLCFNIFPGGESYFHKIIHLAEPNLVARNTNKLQKKKKKPKKKMRIQQKVAVEEDPNKSVLVKEQEQKEELQNQETQLSQQSSVASIKKMKTLIENQIQNSTRDVDKDFNNKVVNILNRTYFVVHNYLKQRTALHKFFRKTRTIEVPLTRDIYGLTVLDIILGLRQEDIRLGIDIQGKINRQFSPTQKKELEKQEHDMLALFQQTFFHYKRDKDVLNKTGDTLSEQYASIIFSEIKDYGLLHSGDVIAQAVAKSVDPEINVPGIFRFLDSRFIEPKHKPNTMNQEIKSGLRESLMSYGKGEADGDEELSKYGASPFDPWARNHDIKAHFYERELNATESPMEMKYFDIMHLHTGSQEGTDFISNLNKREDMKPFQFDSTFVLVNYHWKSVRKQFVRYLVYPYLVTLMAVFLANNIFFKSDKSIMANFVADKIIAIIILTYAVVTASFEVMQIKERTSCEDSWWEAIRDFFQNYLGDPWNVIDVINIGSLLYISLSNLIWSSSKLPAEFWAVSALMQLVIYIKLIYFLRMFKQFNWMIQLIIESFSTISNFVFVLGISVIMFATAFSAHAKYLDGVARFEEQADTYENSGSMQLWKDQDNEPYLTSLRDGIRFSVLLSLGEFDDKIPTAGEHLGSILFFMATLFNLIVMMNLLIAIFSEVHDLFQEQRHQQRIKQFSILVQDIREILYCVRKSDYDHVVDDYMMLFFTRVDTKSVEKTVDIFADQTMFEDETKEDPNEAATDQFLESMLEMSNEIEVHKEKQRKATNIIKKLIIKFKNNLGRGRARTTFSPGKDH